MEKIRKTLLITILILIFSSLTVMASENFITIGELIDRGKEYDSKDITIKGEAIGELLERGEYSFLNINDGTSALGIYLKTEEGKLVKCYGDYHNNGDILKVTGTFNRACKDHGGDMDLHCTSIELLSNGHKREHIIESWKVYLILILTPFVIYGFTKIYKSRGKLNL